jgi:hypothetical protein
VLTPYRYRAGVDVASAVGPERESGLCRHADPGGDEGLHDDDVVACGCNAWGETFLPTHGDQLVPTE